MATDSPAKTDTRTKILRLAEQLLQNKGFNGFSYHDIAEPLGIKNAAVHYHFPSKADLGVALIRRYRQILAASSRTFMRTGKDPMRQLDGYFAFCRRRCETSGGICPIAVVATDYNTVPQPMRDEAARLAEETVAWLSRVFEAGRAEGLLSFEGNPDDKAVQVQAALQGAGQLARFHGLDAMDATIRQVQRDLGLES